MPVEVSLNTPLAEALNAAIQPKLVEVGWGTGGADDSALAEYIILMLVNGKTQDEIASELSGDLLNLGPDDPSTRDFSQWLFQQIDALSSPANGGSSMPDASQEGAGAGDMDTDMNAGDVSELNAPTGPRSMRNGNQRGGRDKRMFGQINKAMDRAGDASLHRVRGQTGGERINTHGRNPPTGPRTGRGGMGRNNNNRAANLQAGLNAMAAGGPQAQWMMQGNAPNGPNAMELVAMLEQQNQVMFQLSQQIMANGGNPGQFGQQRRGGKGGFERGQNSNRGNFRRGQNHHHDRQGSNKPEGEGEGEDVDMSGEKREPPNPEDTVCKYNLKCTNKDCKFAHQSPAAPHGVSVDVNDICTFGAACKNRKCVARHPSPAARLAHQSEQDCKFFPNCQNPRCPFKHPSMPLCRNGADCTTANCKFTHVKTKCRFNPCLNPHCAFAHEEGQQGGFKDKVWTADGKEEHVSERKFVDEQAGEELIKAEEDPKEDTDIIG